MDGGTVFLILFTDVLDEFAATKLDTPSAPASSGPGRPLPATVATASSEPPPLPSLPPGLDASSEDDEFAKQLQAGMASLLGELESSPEMQKQFEEMMRELGQQAAAETEGTAGGEIPGLPPFSVPKDAAAPASASVTASEAAKAESSFQETIKRTMERMQESGEAAGAAAASSQPESDIMAALLREMENGGGEGGDDDFSKMLMGIMEQLTNKEILYEPMKELHDKFPAWMEKNKGKVSADDMKRYEEQKSLATEIVAKFEEPGYSDENVDSRQYIVDRMQKVRHFE